MKLLLAATVTLFFVRSSEFKGNREVPKAVKGFISYEPDQHESFYTGFNGDGSNSEEVDDFSDWNDDIGGPFTNAGLPIIPLDMESQAMNAFRKPLNQEEILNQDFVRISLKDWVDADSDSLSFSEEIYNPTREASFYTGEGSVDTPDIPLNPSTAELEALEKNVNVLEAKSVTDKK